MSLAAHLLTVALLAASPEAPRVLTDAEPSASLRWQTMPLHAGPADARRSTFELHALAPTVLRIEGGVSAKCAPGVARRFGGGPVFADVPVAVSSDSVRSIVVVPPSLAHGGSDAIAEADEPGATFVLAWPSSCGPRPPRVFQATMQEEEEGWLRVRQALDSLASARPSDEELTAALRAEHAHDWQVLAALGIATRRLLGDLPGTDAETPRWVEAWRAGVTRASPMPGVQYDWHAPIDWPAPSRALGSDDKPSFELAAREVREVDVHRAEVVRLHVRLPLRTGESGAVTTLLEVRFDDRPAWVLPLVGGRDPAEPGTTRARTFMIPVPFGARSLQLRSLDRAWLVRGELLWTKGHLQDATRGVLAALRPRAAELAATDVRARLARAVTAGLAGDPGALVTAAGLASGHLVLAAWVAVERARLDGDVAAAERVVTAAIAAPSAGDLARATLALIEQELDDVRARAALAGGEPTSAVRILIRASSRRALTDEEASFLADAQALVPDEVTVGTHLVALIDGLLAHRPLDRMLVAARSRAFALGGTWRPLVARGVGAELTFLDPMTGVPSPTGRSQFAPLGPEGLNVDVAPPTLAGRMAVLSLVAVGTGAPEVRTVRLDGRVWARLPVTSAVERYDVPAEPGPHRLTVEPADTGARTFSDFATAPAGPQFRARRYREIGRDGLELQAGALGVPTVAEVSLRMVGAEPVTPFEAAVDLGGGRVTRVSIGARGARTAPANPVIFVVPLPADAARPRLSATPPGGSRLFAHVAIRVRRPWQGAPVPPGVEAARSAADVATPGPIARAARMIDADEVLLARETLLSVLEDESATREERRLATSLWRDLDAGAITTSTQRTLSPALCLLAQTTAGAVPPAELEVLAAARDAEAAGQVARAASLWLRLADAHPTCGAIRRQAGLALLAGDPSGATAASASVQLALAADVDPGDLMTARAIRRAHRRTRIRWFPFAEQSAGSVLVQLPRGETSDPLEADVLGLPRDGREAGVLAKDREMTFAFSAARRERLVMRVEPIELRRRTAEATEAPPVSVLWSYDGADARTVACDVDHSCQVGPLDVTPGAHLVTARLGGGVRPAARLWLDETPVVRRAGLMVPPASGTTFTAEYLAATALAPIRVTLQGPVVLRLELRRRVTAGGAGAALVRAVARDAPPIERALMLSSVVDPAAVGPDLETLSEPTVAEIPLPAAAAYTIDVSPQGTSPKDRTLLARVGVRDGIDDPILADEPPPLSYVSREAPPAFEPQTLDRAPTVVVRDGDVVPGREVLGSLSAWTLGQRVTTNPEGAPVQALTSLHVGLTYRKLVERLHTIFKADGAERVHDSGAPSQALSTSLFFMHPEHRWLRLSADADGYSQVYASTRQWAGRLTLLAEPVVTIVSGLHLVTKVGSWWSAHTLSRAAVPDVRLLDPDVYSTYSDRHRRALTWEEGLETEPLSNLVLYGNARLTTNPSFRPNDADHVSASLFARTLLGRTYLEGLGRTTWFLADANRLRSSRHSWFGGRFFQTFWPSERQMVELGVVAGYDFGTHSPEVSVSVAWEGSNGRRFRDHSPFEGEDFFFPERGPGFSAAEMKVAP